MLFVKNINLCALTLGLSVLLCACGGSDSAVPVASTVPVPATEKDLAASRPGELLLYVQSRLTLLASEGRSIAAGVTFSAGPVAGTPTSSANAPATLDFSNNPLQEQGVDEDDLIKTDGVMIYSLVGPSFNATSPKTGRLLAYERDIAGVVKNTAALDIAADSSASGMFLLAPAKRLALLGRASSGKIDLTLVDISRADALNVITKMHIDGSLVGTRRIGNILYLTSTWTPVVSTDKSSVSALTTADLLPTIQTGSKAAEPLLSDTDCYVQTKNASPEVQLTTITAIDLSTPNLDRRSRCFVGGSEALYVSEKNIYVATTRYTYVSPIIKPGTGPQLIAPNLSYPSDIKTDIHKFSVSGLNIAYQASAEVNGHLGWHADRKSYRFSEFNDDLRILTFTGQVGWAFSPASDVSAAVATSPAPSPATLTVLRQIDGQLLVIGQLPNPKRPAPIGLPNEQVYAVRLIADRGFVVTFRQTDPLYLLDLSDPADPRAAGELKAPGFSDYLFPIGRDLLLGVGKDANALGQLQGVKLGLYDVSNLSMPKEIATRVIGQRGSTSALDYSAHGINLFTQGDVTRIAVPVRVNQLAVPNSPGFFAPSYQSLFRFEVNTSTHQLLEKPAILGTQFSAVNPWATPGLYDELSIGQSRSVQVADQIYYLNGGLLTGHSW
jgi:Beta propeller domain